MAHAQKPHFVFQRNWRVHLNRRGRQFSRLLAPEVYASAVVMLDTPWSEVVWRVLATHSIRQFPLHFPLPCVTVCHHISTGVYCSKFSSRSSFFWDVTQRRMVVTDVSGQRYRSHFQGRRSITVIQYIEHHRSAKVSLPNGAKSKYKIYVFSRGIGFE